MTLDIPTAEDADSLDIYNRPATGVLELKSGSPLTDEIIGKRIHASKNDEV